jgi:hypothetical protein
MVLCKKKGQARSLSETESSSNLCLNPEWVFCLGFFGPFFFSSLVPLLGIFPSLIN